MAAILSKKIGNRNKMAAILFKFPMVQFWNGVDHPSTSDGLSFTIFLCYTRIMIWLHVIYILSMSIQGISPSFLESRRPLLKRLPVFLPRLAGRAFYASIALSCKSLATWNVLIVRIYISKRNEKRSIKREKDWDSIRRPLAPYELIDE